MRTHLWCAAIPSVILAASSLLLMRKRVLMQKEPAAHSVGSSTKVRRMKTFTLVDCGWLTPFTVGRKPSRLMAASGMAEAGMATNLGMRVAKTLRG